MGCAKRPCQLCWKLLPAEPDECKKKFAAAGGGTAAGTDGVETPAAAELYLWRFKPAACDAWSLCWPNWPVNLLKLPGVCAAAAAAELFCAESLLAVQNTMATSETVTKTKAHHARSDAMSIPKLVASIHAQNIGMQRDGLGTVDHARNENSVNDQLLLQHATRFASTALLLKRGLQTLKPWHVLHRGGTWGIHAKYVVVYEGSIPVEPERERDQHRARQTCETYIHEEKAAGCCCMTSCRACMYCSRSLSAKSNTANDSMRPTHKRSERSQTVFCKQQQAYALVTALGDCFRVQPLASPRSNGSRRNSKRRRRSWNYIFFTRQTLGSQKVRRILKEQACCVLDHARRISFPWENKTRKQLPNNYQKLGCVMI